MKIVMTLLVRDEADILEEQLAFHLNAGVDFVIATDHRSEDGTTEILRSHESRGVLRVIREEGEFAQQAAWQTRMARIAAVEYDADWVINSDADEFWWPRGESLAQVLGSVPSRFGVVRGLVRNFVPRRMDVGWFAERATVRLATPAAINDPATPFRPVVKAVHRAHPEVVIWKGSHQVFGAPGALLSSWYPLEVLHVPLRSREQCVRKYRKTWTGWEENLRGDLSRARDAYDEGRRDALWERISLDDDELERGLADGMLVSDTRLRDGLTSLRGEFTTPGRAELDAHVFDAAVFEEAELVRHQRWVDELGARVRALERRTDHGIRRVRSR